MNTQQLELWHKLQAFSIDEPNAEYPFSVRLAMENNWSEAFAQNAILEYKKFLFLAKVTDSPVSPSEVVDKVWHLHLIYTHSYWNDLCKNVLEMQFNHNPSNGGVRESRKYGNMRNDTLEKYRTFFGEPPENIWNDTIQLHSLPQMPTWQKRIEENSVSVFALVFLSTTFICFQLFFQHIFNIKGVVFLVGYALAGIISLVISRIVNHLYAKKLAENFCNTENKISLTPYEMAYLRTNDSLSISSALMANFIGNGYIEYDKTSKSYQILKPLPQESTALEKTVWNFVEEKISAAKANFSMIELHEALKNRPAYKQVMNFVEEIRLAIENEENVFYAKWIPITLWTLLASFGLGRIIYGLMMGKPVIFLIIMVLIVCIPMYLSYQYNKNSVYRTYIPQQYASSYSSELNQHDNMAWQYGLHGYSGMDMLMFSALTNGNQMHHAQDSGSYVSSCGGSSDTSGGSSCGGDSGGGGGCGGCGSSCGGGCGGGD